MEDGVVAKGNQPGKDEITTDKNPMLIPVVLDMIIKCLPFKDLKSCRLISKLWNETVTRSKHFKLKSKDSIVFGYHKGYHLRNTSYYSVRRMDRLGDCLSSSFRMGNFPLHTFNIATSIVDLDLKESTVRDFLNAISPIAQNIHIRHGREFAPLGKIGAANWNVFPKLKYLKLSLLELELGIIWKLLAHVMGDGNAPQLEKLNIRWKLRGIPDSSVSNLISTINVPVTTSKLKSLKIKHALQLKHLREFNALELNLTEFHIAVENISDFEASSTLRSILQKQSKTLYTLEIVDCKDKCKNVHSMVDVFPLLPNLETLIIYTTKTIFADILLKERFPRLKSLILTGTSSPWKEFFGKQIEATLSLNELRVTGWLAKDGILHKAAVYFPNIRILHIPAVSYVTNFVFDKMSQLEELTLDTKDVRLIDNIITGMTLKECEDFVAKMTDWRKNVEVLESIEDVPLTTKPISCLTKLKTLRLYSVNAAKENEKYRSKKMEITKLSYLMVLLNMDSLRCIDFGERFYPPNYQLQPSVWRRATEKFKILCTMRSSYVYHRPSAFNK